MSKNYFDIIRQYWDKPAVTEPSHSQVSPNAHTADLLTRSRYRAEGAQTERERIIKLLEEYAGIGEDCLEHRDLCNCTFNGRAIDIIALIKGEQK